MARKRQHIPITGPWPTSEEVPTSEPATVAVPIVGYIDAATETVHFYDGTPPAAEPNEETQP